MSERQQLVLLPGLLCTAALWEHQTETLNDIADTWVPDLTAAESVSELARLVLKDAPHRFALAGLSMGGYVALEIMRQAPERVERLALLDTSARPDTAEQTRRRRGLISLSERGKFKGVTPRLLPLLIHPDRLEDRDLVDTVTGMAEDVGGEAFRRQQFTILGRPDSRPGLIDIPCRTLVIVGRQDALTPVEVAQEMVANLKQGRLAVIEDCGHLSALERPQAVTALMRDWLIYDR